MEQKIIIDNLDTARLACPECQRAKTLQLSEYKLNKRHTRVKYKCNCGHTYTAILEKKSSPQHDTMLARNGRYLTAEFTSTEHYDNLGLYLFFNKLYV